MEPQDLKDIIREHTNLKKLIDRLNRGDLPNSGDAEAILLFIDGMKTSINYNILTDMDLRADISKLLGIFLENAMKHGA
jgi:hypothetical protein